MNNKLSNNSPHPHCEPSSYFVIVQQSSDSNPDKPDLSELGYRLDYNNHLVTSGAALSQIYMPIYSLTNSPKLDLYLVTLI